MGIAGTTRCMCESRSHNDESVDELLISSLSVQRVLEPKRQTLIGSQANSTKFVQSKSLVAIKR